MATRRQVSKTVRKVLAKKTARVSNYGSAETIVRELSNRDIDRIVSGLHTRMTKNIVHSNEDAPINICAAASPFETFGLDKDARASSPHKSTMGPRTAIEEGWTHNSVLHCMLDNLEKALDPILVPQPDIRADPAPVTEGSTELMNMLESLTCGQKRLIDRLESILNRINL